MLPRRTSAGVQDSSHAGAPHRTRLNRAVVRPLQDLRDVPEQRQQHLKRLTQQQQTDDPIADEAIGVAALDALTRDIRPLGAEQLLYAHVPLARLAGATYTPGAMLPDAAQRLTRP